MKTETEIRNGLAKGNYGINDPKWSKNLPFNSINLIQVLYLPDSILNEYVSPDINLFKEKQKIGDAMECFGGGGSKEA